MIKTIVVASALALVAVPLATSASAQTIGDVRAEIKKGMALRARLNAALAAGTVDVDAAHDAVFNKCPDADEVSASAREISRTRDLNVVAKVYAQTLTCNSAVSAVLANEAKRPPASAAESTYPPFQTCRLWLKHYRLGDKINLAQVSWVYGFIDGINLVNTNREANSPNASVGNVGQHISEYCELHSDHKVWDAALAFVNYSIEQNQKEKK